jgi:hypothetical protein
MSAPTPRETLERALRVIADPMQWAQGGLARDRAGHIVEVFAPGACQWCALGALHKAAGEGAPSYSVRVMELLDDAATMFGWRSIVDMNDRGVHADVVEAFKRAIAACAEVGA